jgi:ribosomal protein S18 acetylase RimI-like enzyme
MHRRMVRLRAAVAADLADILPRTRELNDHEGIAVSDADLARALRRLLDDASLGGVWLVERGGQVVGYAIVTYGYDLEFAGSDAWLTELWIDEAARGAGTGSEVLRLLGDEVKARGVNALHLQVREENPALRLYQRAGFSAVPRLILTKRL